MLFPVGRMMKVKAREIIQRIESKFPKSFACEWDNVGLLAGNPDKEVKSVYIALDATDEVIEDAISLGADMLLTHHPLIFKGLKRVTTEDFIGRRMIRLIQKDMVYYAMHTNYDVMGMADLSAEMLNLKDAKVLDVTCVADGKEEGIGRLGNLPDSMTLKECVKYTQKIFSLEQVKVFGNPDTIVNVAAVSPGSGKSEIRNAIAAGAEVLITGDIDHHEGIDAVAQGLCIIDAGHYGTEHIFVEDMETYLHTKCEDVEVFTQKLSFPFWIA